jgi:biotin synthase-related radical SAM superfamily protein
MGGRTAVFKITNKISSLILRIVDENIYDIEEFINKYKEEQKKFGKYMIDIIQYGIKNGKNHLAIGYLPCRILKAISYGNIGLTDSYLIKQILGEHVLYDPDMKTLFEMAMRERTNYERITSSMKYVEENHTYLNRARDLIRAMMQ